jgi:predicted RNase H-like HicB family nuclease
MNKPNKVMTTRICRRLPFIRTKIRETALPDESEREMLRFALTDYIEKALSLAEYDKLEDGTFAGRIPSCTGVIAFAETLRACENELQSTLEDWLLLGLKLGHPIPVIEDGYDLNYDTEQETDYEPMAAV